jgi:hypothetical protein
MVDIVLDLAGYTPDKRLAELVAVEPSHSDSSFVGNVLNRRYATG